jgi:CubicO group peptidase (beta-lactamase class C family)
MSEPTVQGTCATGFEPVRDAFVENFVSRGDIGASLAVCRDGEVIIDLWGGWADAAGTRPWDRDTIVNVWSTTKGLTAMTVHRLVDQGRLDLDAPVAEYWPEFAAAGKADLPVRWLLCHRSGLAALRDPLSAETYADWDEITSRLAATEPWWEPGTKSGYHAMTFGFLVGEVARRVDGRTIGAQFREDIAEPLGVDAHIGLPASEDHRVAELTMGEPPSDSSMAEMFSQLDPAAAAALTNPMVGPADANALWWRRAEIPAANGHTNGRALARLYGAIAKGGGDVLTAAGAERLRESQGVEPDIVISAGAGGAPFEWGLGVAIGNGDYGPNPRAFGHDGFGGSFGFADPEAGVGVGYAMNSMGFNLVGDPRKVAMLDALYACL